MENPTSAPSGTATSKQDLAPPQTPPSGSPRLARGRRADYASFETITTRWMDNDVYGHVNNVVYYSWFDTAVNKCLIGAGLLDFLASPVIGLVVETRCAYFSSVAFPDTIHAGIRVGHIGSSSVRYEIGLFRNGEDEASAEGHFIHVYVDRASNRPVKVVDPLRGYLEGLRKVKP